MDRSAMIEILDRPRTFATAGNTPPYYLTNHQIAHLPEFPTAFTRPVLALWYQDEMLLGIVGDNPDVSGRPLIAYVRVYSRAFSQ